MTDTLESVGKDNSSVKTQIPQLEEYLSELLKLGFVSYYHIKKRQYTSVKENEGGEMIELLLPNFNGHCS
jgi:adenylate cyclase class IV